MIQVKEQPAARCLLNHCAFPFRRSASKYSLHAYTPTQFIVVKIHIESKKEADTQRAPGSTVQYYSGPAKPSTWFRLHPITGEFN
jgi:hypothetical protein